MTHHFNVETAARHGVACAIILENIFYWCHENWLNKRNLVDGKAYTYNSYKAWKELYPYLKERQIGDSIRYLEKENLIESVTPNKMDRTKWYAITAKGIAELSERNFMADDMPSADWQNENDNEAQSQNATEQRNVQNHTMHDAKTHGASCKNARCMIRKRAAV